MKWKGTVAHWLKIRMPHAFTPTKIHHPTSMRWCRKPRASRSPHSGGLEINAIADAPYRRDDIRPELLPQSSDVDVHNVCLRVEVVAPHRRQQARFGHTRPGVLHQLR